MTTKLIMYIGCILFLSAAPALATGADDILGVWNNGEKDAKIELFKCGTRYCGKVIWLKEPKYPAESKDGMPGTPKLDHNNPKAGLRSAPVIGLQIVHDFIYDGGNRWVDGKVYDPKNGKTYSGKMTLVSAQQLELRGFIGISLLGRTTSWTK